MAAKQGEVWLADLGLAAKTRPVVILSRDDPQAPRALVTYVPVTTQNRGSPYEVDLGNLRFLNEASVANRRRGSGSGFRIAFLSEGMGKDNLVSIETVLVEFAKSLGKARRGYLRLIAEGKTAGHQPQYYDVRD